MNSFPNDPFVWMGDKEETNKVILLPEGFYEFETVGFRYSYRPNKFKGGVYRCIELRIKVFYPEGFIIINCPMAVNGKLADSYFQAINFPPGTSPTYENTVGAKAGCHLAVKEATIKSINSVTRFVGYDNTRKDD